MKIAVTYQNEEVFQHFGKTEQFKIYEVENKEVTSSSVISTNGVGHEALAEFLAEQNVDVVICGGLGQGAKDALASVFIEVISGASGACDEAVRAYLNNELVSQDVNCDHHDHHEEEECEGCGGNCGGGCGGCGGGCGGPQIIHEGINAGKIVKVHYEGTLDDGSKFDSSYDRGEPLQFIAGVGMMIPGFDKAVVNMQPGDTTSIHLEPAEAYGEIIPEYVITVKMSDMPGSENLNVGERVILSDTAGQRFPVIVTNKDDVNITFDANHEMAGKALNFLIELVEVQ